MAHKRQDTLTKSPEWWDHLRKENKRRVAKAERRAATRQIKEQVDIRTAWAKKWDETPEAEKDFT